MHSVEMQIYAAILHLSVSINISDMYVCMYVCMLRYLLSSDSSAPLVCRHDQVTREAGRVGLVGRDRGSRGYWVTL